MGANSDCDEGFLCKNFNYALKCHPEEANPLSYSALCNDEKVDGFCEGEPVDPSKELDCVTLADFGSAVGGLINHPNTNCVSNYDCSSIETTSKCRLFDDRFLACDRNANFVGNYRALCPDV